MRTEKSDSQVRRSCAGGSTVTRANTLRRRCLAGRLAGAVLILSLAGCTQLTRPDQLTTGQQADPDAFLHEHLQNQAVVTAGEAYRAMLMLADGQDTFTTFEQREEELVRRGILRSAWKLESDQAVDHGTVAYMVLQILHIRGGVNAQVFGRLGLGDRRYAMRELVYVGLATREPDYHFMSGGELVDLIARADDYLVRHGRYELQKVDIQQEVDRQKQAAASAPAR